MNVNAVVVAAIWRILRAEREREFVRTAVTALVEMPECSKVMLPLTLYAQGSIWRSQHDRRRFYIVERSERLLTLTTMEAVATVETPFVATEVAKADCQTADWNNCICGLPNRDFIFRGLIMCFKFQGRIYIRGCYFLCFKPIAIVPLSG
jgi:hypothetical protein